MASRLSITVLISGGGTTLRNLLDLQNRGALDATIKQVISSRADATGNQYAVDANIPLVILPAKQYASAESLSQELFESVRETGTDLVVAGGFLRRLVIPDDFENRVINIHPSLIPAFCGKGFYGMRVHESVIQYGCKLSGCTVHFVDNEYDHGPIIAQRSVEVLPEDSAKGLQQKIFAEECQLYPDVINQIAAGRVSVVNRTVRISD
ncbi:MAG: phosphoribosylglycinamide formyltransferase [Mariniblastus sp.]|nr:phosphoribosylglycinamide formyltransferase [Mariniblastus sp.]